MTSGGPPPVSRLSTPECVSSPVSHLRNLTKDLDEGARRERAAQYLRETREQHLQQRRLYLVLDLDETLVHSLRQTVRPLHGPGSRPPPQRQQHARNGEAACGEAGSGEGEEGEEEEEEEAAVDGAAGPLPEGADSQVTLTVQNVQFEMQLRPGGSTSSNPHPEPYRTLAPAPAPAPALALTRRARLPRGDERALLRAPVHDGLARVRAPGAAPPRSGPLHLQARPGLGLG